MNIITFDTEEWYIEKMYHGAREEKYRSFNLILDNLLELLSNKGFIATFFCVGRLADEFPSVIKKIDASGHEIGCHSDTHQWLNKMTDVEVYQDTHNAIDKLEQLIGKKVISYRAPAFSIGSNNKQVLEILAECGIKRDASIFPAARDFGGFAEFTSEEPTLITIGNKQIKEFPITTTTIFGKRLAYSGGGYFRLFPYSFIKNRMSQAEYTMTYFHINDLLSTSRKFQTRKEYERYYREKGTLINRGKRYLKTIVGTNTAYPKLQKLLQENSFVNLVEADNAIDWTNAPHITL